MCTESQREANKRYYEKNKAKMNKQSSENYQKNKKDRSEQQHNRYIQIRNGAYRWNNRIVTGYLPYAQGNKKERVMEVKL